LSLIDRRKSGDAFLDLKLCVFEEGRQLPLKGMLPEDMHVVGEGSNSYFLYLGETNVGKARVLLTFGLDLLSGEPEANCLLDNIIHYVRSNAFAPKGSLPASIVTVGNP
jgi:hypothetical protein